MANSVTTQVLANTDRKLVIKRVMVSDGTEEDQAVIVDISDSAYNHSDGTALSGVAIEKMYYTLDSSSTANVWNVGWAATTLHPIFLLGGKQDTTSGFFDFGSEWGGLTKDSITINAGTAAGEGTPNGDIASTTATFDANEGYTIILVMRKIF